MKLIVWFNDEQQHDNPFKVNTAQEYCLEDDELLVTVDSGAVFHFPLRKVMFFSTTELEE